MGRVYPRCGGPSGGCNRTPSMRQNLYSVTLPLREAGACSGAEIAEAGSPASTRRTAGSSTRIASRGATSPRATAGGPTRSS